MAVPSIKPLAAGCILGALALASCDAGKPVASQAQASVGPAGFRLDESKLPQVPGFKASDLDAGASACSDLDAYVNGKWKAANPIPADRTDWGLSFNAALETGGVLVSEKIKLEFDISAIKNVDEA